MKKLTRRKFLFASSAAIGLGINAIRQPQSNSQISSQANILANTWDPTQRRVINPAPEGLFAPPKGDIRLVVFSDLNLVGQYLANADSSIRHISNSKGD